MSSLVVATVKRVADPKLRIDDGRIDRLNHRYTSTMLIVFAILVSTQQYVGRPIQCWCPEHFKKQHVEYANSYCWISGTFHLPFNSSIPKASVRYTMERSYYYQWVPLILLAQALLFNLPCLLWRSLSDRCGVDINSIIITGNMLATVQMTPEIRKGLHQRILLLVTRYLKSFHTPKLSLTLSLKHLVSRTCCFMCGHREGNYLTTLYITTKVLYLINAVGQLFTLNVFLGQDFHVYGAEVIRAAYRGDDWTGSFRFPRVNLCDFKLRRMGNVQNVQQYTLQCVLPINLFNEKIFLFLWFWFIAISLLTLLDTLYWFFFLVLPVYRTRFIKRHLMLAEQMSVEDDVEKKKEAVVFTEKHLSEDGVFLLRLLQHNTNCITAMEATSNLWLEYRNRSANPEAPSDETPSTAPTMKLSWADRFASGRAKKPITPTAPPVYEFSPQPNGPQDGPMYPLLSKEQEAELDRDRDI